MIAVQRTIVLEEQITWTEGPVLGPVLSHLEYPVSKKPPPAVANGVRTESLWVAGVGRKGKAEMRPEVVEAMTGLERKIAVANSVGFAEKVGLPAA